MLTPKVPIKEATFAPKYSYIYIYIYIYVCTYHTYLHKTSVSYWIYLAAVHLQVLYFSEQLQKYIITDVLRVLRSESGVAWQRNVLLYAWHEFRKMFLCSERISTAKPCNIQLTCYKVCPMRHSIMTGGKPSKKTAVTQSRSPWSRVQALFLQRCGSVLLWLWSRGPLVRQSCGPFDILEICSICDVPRPANAAICSI